MALLHSTVRLYHRSLSVVEECLDHPLGASAVPKIIATPAELYTGKQVPILSYCGFDSQHS